MIARAAMILALSVSAAAAEIVRGRAEAIDGDTIRMAGQRIRLVALDCPELAHPGGHAARDALASLIAGIEIVCARADTDRHGRMVAHCGPAPRFSTDDDLTCRMIRSGHCRRYVRYDPRGLYTHCERGR